MDQRAAHNEEYTGYLKHLGQSLDQEGTKVSSFFRQLDRQRNGILQCREIKEGVKENLQDQFGGLNFNKLEKALDLNGNGILSEEEFVKLISDAKQSQVSTKQYNAISKIGASPPRKANVPLGGKPVEKSKTLVDTVLPQHKLTSQEMVGRFK